MLLVSVAGANAAPCSRPGGPSFRDEFWRVNGPAHPLIGQVLKGETPIAIEPADCERSPLQQLIAEGRASPATRSHRDLPPPIKLPPGSPSASEILRQMRDEDDW